MSNSTRTGLLTLGAALCLGILGDQLLSAAPWGPSAVVWLGALALGCFAIARWRSLPLTGGGRWLIFPALVFAGALAWHDSAVLRTLNLLTAVALLALAVARTRAGRLRVAGLAEYGADSVLAGVDGAVGLAVLLARDVRWQEIPRGSRSQRLAAVARGLLLAVPLLLVFGALLVAADAAFQNLVGDIFKFDPGSTFSHLLAIALWCWVAAGMLRSTLRARVARVAVPGHRRLGMVEAGVVLGLLDALFLAFVLVQSRYLFGGVPPAEAGGLDPVAAYARRGFFELVAVAVLVLPLLHGLHWLARPEEPAHVRAFNGLAGLMVLLLFAIMSSALQRMNLYVYYFGLTELRLYTTAFMALVALVFVWFAFTVLRGRRAEFAFGVVAAWCVLVAGLNALDPDALIVRVNVEREVAWHSTVPFDASYAAGLSADAVPVLFDALGQLPDEQSSLLAWQLLHRWSPPAARDWRTWNLGRAQAWAAVEAQAGRLQELSTR